MMPTKFCNVYLLGRPQSCLWLPAHVFVIMAHKQLPAAIRSA